MLFSISAQFSSIWPIDRTLSGDTTSDLSGPKSDGNKGVLCVPQSSSIVLFNTNYSIEHNSFVCTPSNGSKYCSVSLTIQSNIFYTQLNDQTVLLLTIQFSISHLFAFSLNVLFDPYIGSNRVLPLRAKVNQGAMKIKGYSAFPKSSALLETHYKSV